MALRFVLLAGCAFLSLCANAWALMSAPDYRLQNRLKHAIRVEVVSHNGKSQNNMIVKPGGEVDLPDRGRRLVVYTPTRTGEYALPAVLHMPRKSPGSEVVKSYASMINGRWRLIVSEARSLGIIFVGGGSVHEPVPEFTKPPLLFPLRPRSSSESFADYEAALDSKVRTELRKATRP